MKGVIVVAAALVAGAILGATYLCVRASSYEMAFTGDGSLYRLNRSTGEVIGCGVGKEALVCLRIIDPEHPKRIIDLPLGN